MFAENDASYIICQDCSRSREQNLGFFCTAMISTKTLIFYYLRQYLDSVMVLKYQRFLKVESIF